MIKKSVNQHNIILFSILLLAILVRVAAITTRPIWYDEAFAILFAEKGVQALVAGTLTPVGGVASDVHPLAYYMLLYGWMKLLGQSLTSVRLLSVLFGVGTILIVYVFARSLAGEKMALISAALVGLSPFQIHYAQEIRMYALLAFFLVATTLALWYAMREDRWYWWTVFTICILLAQFTHNLAIFYIFPVALTPIYFRQWRTLRRVILAGCIAMLMYLPWLLQLPGQFAKVQQSYWTTNPTPSRLVTTFLSFTTNLPVPTALLPVALFVTFILLFLAGWQTFIASRLKLPHFKHGLWLCYLTLSPIILMFLFSQWQPVFIERGLIASGVMFLVWLSWVITETNKPRLVQGLLVLMILLGFAIGFYQHIFYNGFPYGPYSEIAQYLNLHSSRGDVILHSNKLTMLPMVYYDRDLPQKYLMDPPGSGADTLARPTQDMLGLIAEASVEEGVGNATKVWFVIFNKAITEYHELGYKTHPQLAWLEDHFVLNDVENWGDISIYVFTR